MAAALVASSRTSAPGIRVPSGASLHGGASVLHFVLGSPGAAYAAAR